jgi:hypothetical protein
MRLIAALAASAIAAAACGGPAAAPSPSPTPTPTPSPTPSNVFKAELKSSNENPPISDAEATCSGNATVTFSGTSTKFDVTITGCPATTVINIGHIHEQVAGQNGPVVIDSTLKPGELTLVNGAVTFTRTNSNSDPAVVAKVMANPAGFYVNFHSAVHGGGVIRGQLTKA